MTLLPHPRKGSKIRADLDKSRPAIASLSVERRQNRGGAFHPPPASGRGRDGPSLRGAKRRSNPAGLPVTASRDCRCSQCELDLSCSDSSLMCSTHPSPVGAGLVPARPSGATKARSGGHKGRPYGKQSHSRAALLTAPRVLPTMFTNGRLKEHDPEKCSRFSDQIMLPQKGGGAPKGAVVDTAGPPTSVAACLCAHGARRFWRTRSPSGALPRLSPKPFGLGSVRSRASWQRQRM